MNGSASGHGTSINGNKIHNEVSKNQLRHRQLTPLRACRGLLCIAVLLSTAFMMLAFWAPIITLFLRLFSIHYSRKATSLVFATWLSLWPFLFEKINKTKVVFSGETVPEKERVVLFANHRTEVDWMYLWNLALRKGRLGYIKYILKSSLMMLPIFGWGFQILEFISVERKWEIDEPIMRRKLSHLGDSRDPLWLVVFPEGTDYTEAKCTRSQKFAAENGLPVLNNVLLPKTRGFIACLEALRSSLDAVYDVTIAYKHHCPTFIDNLFGVDPSEVHIHIQRILLRQIPTSEHEAAGWLMERFRLKDQLLSDFTARGSFPNQGTEGDLNTSICVAKCFVVLALTSIFIYITLSCLWCKIYVGLSCAYLTILAYFDVQITPVLGFARAQRFAKKTL